MIHLLIKNAHLDDVENKRLHLSYVYRLNYWVTLLEYINQIV